MTRTNRKVWIVPVDVFSEPRPGFFKARLKKRGPYVPVALCHEPTRDPETGDVLDRTWWWSLEVGGELVADPSPNWRRACGIYAAIGLAGEEITAEEYIEKLRHRDWAVAAAPMMPEANPLKPVDLDRLPPLFARPTDG